MFKVLINFLSEFIDIKHKVVDPYDFKFLCPSMRRFFKFY